MFIEERNCVLDKIQRLEPLFIIIVETQDIFKWESFNNFQKNFIWLMSCLEECVEERGLIFGIVGGIVQFLNPAPFQTKSVI